MVKIRPRRSTLTVIDRVSHTTIEDRTASLLRSESLYQSRLSHRGGVVAFYWDRAFMLI